VLVRMQSNTQLKTKEGWVEKGIIFSPHIYPEKESGQHATTHEKMNLNDLRFALLFWDKFDVICYERLFYRTPSEYPVTSKGLSFIIDESLAIVDTDGVDLKNITSESLYAHELLHTVKLRNNSIRQLFLKA